MILWKELWNSVTCSFLGHGSWCPTFLESSVLFSCAVLRGSWVWQRYIYGGTILKECGILRIFEYFWREAGLVSLLSKTNAAFTRISPQLSTVHQQGSLGMTFLVSVAVNTHIHYFVMPAINGTCQGWSLKDLFLALLSAVCTHSIPLILSLHRIKFKIASMLSLNW